MKTTLTALVGLMLLPAVCLADDSAIPSHDGTKKILESSDAAHRQIDEQHSVEGMPIDVEHQKPVTINCEYSVPQETDVKQTIITTWAQKAAVQSFQFNPDNLQEQMTALKKCYTLSGWQAFNEALKTSGNLEAIQSNQLIVSSKVNGTTRIKDSKENQWKVTVPLKVVYQNKEKQLEQALDVELLIAHEKSGKFGIMQVIAVPEGTAENKI